MADNKGYITTAEENGTINISEEVVAFIAAGATVEVEGVHGLFISPGKDTIELLAKKSIARGVRIRNDEGGVTADVFIVTKLGAPVNEVGAKVQAACSSAVEAATGITLAAVNVHVCEVSLKQ